MKSFTTDSPALCRIDDPRQGVGHNVEVGRNFQAVELDVIAGVHDDAQRRRFHGTCGAEHHREQDRKSTRLNSSHGSISYAVFCLKKKKIHERMELRKKVLL